MCLHVQITQKLCPNEVLLSLSNEGLSLHAECRTDTAAPLSLDSALQERLQQERASMQSQIELLEKKKNEEIQNLKTSLIAEQQVCNWALNDILKETVMTAADDK